MPAFDGIELTNFGAAINLLPDVTGGREVLKLRIVTAAADASITCKTKGSGTTDRVFSVVQGEEIEMAFRTIESVANVTEIRVEWAEY